MKTLKKLKPSHSQTKPSNAQTLKRSNSKSSSHSPEHSLRKAIFHCFDFY